MSTVGEASEPSANGKPVIVRVKRKRNQSCLDALWLEINETPSKRAALDLERLSISSSAESKVVEVTKVKKVLVEHVETVTIAETSVDIVQSFMAAGDDSVERKTRVFRQENKRESLLSKARQTHELSSQNARFEQIWRSRQGNKVELRDMCHFYDVVRLDAEKTSSAVTQHEEMSLEDQRILSHYLPLLREFIPSAATDIESSVNANLSSPEDDYVYDYYTMKDEKEICEEMSSQFPLVQVEDEDLFDGLEDDSENDSEDSNAEDHPRNEYPDATSEEEEEEEDEEEDEDEDEEKDEDEEEDEEDEEEDEGDGDYYDVLDDYVNGEHSDDCCLDGRDDSDYDVEDDEDGR